IGVNESPKDMFGKTMRVSDDLMFRYYELLTSITPSDLAQLKRDVEEKKRHPREVKVNLAKTLVARFHSQAAAQAAEDEFNRIFVDKGMPDQIDEFKIAAQAQIGLVQLMTTAGLTASNGEATRLITGGGVQIDQQKISDPKLKLDLKNGESFVIKAGKKKFVKIVVG
ncbi:MAG: tyrosyl-tRNA synthetase, partial [Pseudobdellovibrio sp.]|nr:tyrosyl-tRNA synthetase [Pseudobdellovibrio sp.]